MKNTNHKPKTACQQKFNFWRDNRLDGHFTLTGPQLISEFKAWMPTKEYDWLLHYYTRDIITIFISYHLNAVGNNENNNSELEAMAKILKPVKQEYLNSKK